MESGTVLEFALAVETVYSEPSICVVQRKLKSFTNFDQRQWKPFLPPDLFCGQAPVSIAMESAISIITGRCRTFNNNKTKPSIYAVWRKK